MYEAEELWTWLRQAHCSLTTSKESPLPLLVWWWWRDQLRALSTRGRSLKPFPLFSQPGAFAVRVLTVIPPMLSSYSARPLTPRSLWMGIPGTCLSTQQVPRITWTIGSTCIGCVCRVAVIWFEWLLFCLLCDASVPLPSTTSRFPLI